MFVLEYNYIDIFFNKTFATIFIATCIIIFVMSFMEIMQYDEIH
jgi:hypothetical protein